MLPLNITPAWFRSLESNQDPMVQGHVGYLYLRPDRWHARQELNLLLGFWRPRRCRQLERLVGQEGVEPVGRDS